MKRRSFLKRLAVGVVGAAAYASGFASSFADGYVSHEIITVKPGQTVTIGDEFDDGRLHDLTIRGGGTVILTGTIRTRNLTLENGGVGWDGGNTGSAFLGKKPT